MKYKLYLTDELSSTSKDVIASFQKKDNQISSTKGHKLKSNDVLKIIGEDLIPFGFDIENLNVKRIRENIEDKGIILKHYDIDGCKDDYLLEVEAGRAIDNYQILKDFIEVLSLKKYKRMCIALRITKTYGDRTTFDFDQAISIFDALFLNDRNKFDLEELLIIGY